MFIRFPDGREYQIAMPLNPTVTEYLRLTRETEMSVNDIEAAIDRAQSEVADAEKAKRDPDVGADILLGTAMVLYLARWRAGEKVTLETAADVPFDGIEMVAEPGEAPDPTSAPTRAKKKASPRTRRASVPAGRSRGNPARPSA